MHRSETLNEPRRAPCGNGPSRRDLLRGLAAGAGAAMISGLLGCEKRPRDSTATAPGSPRTNGTNEEYVWVSAAAHLPLFVAYDHPALFTAGRELGVKVSIAGPEGVDIPQMVGTIEQLIARRPTGMMVVGWSESALAPAINKAVDAGIPVVCVDADVPSSKRAAFIGTDWHDIGVVQGREMVKALGGRKGKVAMLGLIDQFIDQRAFAGFRSVVEPAGLTVLDPQHDKGTAAEAVRIATATIQAYPDLVGIAGFDSESGPGIGLAIRELKKAGHIVATTVEAEEQVLHYIEQGIITVGIRQKRQLFTYQGVKALYDLVHSPLKFSENDHAVGIAPIPVNYSTGIIPVTRENLRYFLRAQ